MGNNNKKKIGGDMKGKAAGSAISVNRRKKQGQWNMTSSHDSKPHYDLFFCSDAGLSTLQSAKFQQYNNQSTPSGTLVN